MLGAIRQLFLPPPPAEVSRTYIALVQAARNPFFYETLGVPDTLDGRFEMIVLHLFLLQQRLVSERGHASRAAADFAQFLSEAFMNDMDASLREMGVADTGVGKRIKQMGRAYNGRLQAYTQSVHDDHALRAALARNLYGTCAEGNPDHLQRMAQWVIATSASLRAIPLTMILEGSHHWPEIKD